MHATDFIFLRDNSKNQIIIRKWLGLDLREILLGDRYSVIVDARELERCSKLIENYTDQLTLHSDLSVSIPPWSDGASARWLLHNEHELWNDLAELEDAITEGPIVVIEPEWH